MPLLIIKIICFLCAQNSGKEVKVLTASDADATAVLTFTLDTSSTPSSYDTYFVLDGNTLKVKATADLDPPTSASSTFNLIVLVKDGGNPELTGTTTVIVTIKSANEKTPTFVNLPYVVNNVSKTISSLMSSLFSPLIAIGIFCQRVQC